MAITTQLPKKLNSCKLWWKFPSDSDKFVHFNCIRRFEFFLDRHHYLEAFKALFRAFSKLM